MHTRKKRKLGMDAKSVISAFLASSNQYVVCQNEKSLMQLQRHLEIIVCLTTTSSDLGFFQSGNPLASQCITHVVNLLLDTNAKSTLIPRVVSVLQNLSKCPQLNKSLQSTFHVHSAISVFLQHYGFDMKDPIALQCLDLLENVTYKISINYIESHFENLINILLKLIDTESSQLLKTTLRILTNLTRHNVKVQNYILSLSCAKQTVKRIVSMLNTEETQILVYSLSILANVTPNYPIGPKLWTDEHLMTTFKLIFKLLFGCDETSAAAALDLFLDLINVPKFQLFFIKSPYLNSFFKKIPKILSENGNEQSVLYLEILHALVQIPDCNEKVCSILYESDNKNNDAKIHLKIVQWCTSKNINNRASKLALKLLKNIITLHIDSTFSKIENSINETIKIILENLSIPLITETNQVDKDLEGHITVFEILILLCQKTELRNYVHDCINIEMCEELVTVLLSMCQTKEHESSCIDLFLMVMEIISLIEKNTHDSEKISCKILQDHRAMQYLAYALSCNNNEFVNRGLLLISLIKNDSSISVLSKNILLRNANLQRQLSHHSKEIYCSFNSDIDQQTIRRNCPNMDISLEKQIDSLLLKIEKGLSIKEFKRSEIMDLYEHKIAILTRKEQELQNYVEAKTVALQKADQIMTQYKCRQADSDSQALRLRTMLKEYESRCERAMAQFEEAQKNCKSQKEDLDATLRKLKKMEQCEKEQNDLMQTQMNRQYEQKKIFEEEKARLSELLHSKDCEKKTLVHQLQQMEEEMKLKIKALEAVEESREELWKKIDEYKKSMEKMKLNYEQKQSNLESTLDIAQQRITSLEEKKENLMNEINRKVEECKQQVLELESEKDLLKEQIKSKDVKNADLTESIKKLNSELIEKCNSLKETELSIKKLKATLEDTESKNVKLEKDIKMLELLCKRYESSIEKKDSEIKALIDELESTRRQCEETIEAKEQQVKRMESDLETYKNITGMINQMTSGKISPHKNSK